MPVVVRPLTPSRWTDLEAVFDAKGCSAARGCWCMYYREGGPSGPTRAGSAQRARAKAALKALAARDPAPGLVGYVGETPVGWVAVGPREDFAKLARSRIMRPVDAQPVWSIVCFVVPSQHRRRGVARALLAGAIEYARARGATVLEGYPVDKDQPAAADAAWFGSRRMFEQAGFEEIARRRLDRPMMRLALDGTRGARRPKAR